MRHTLHFSLARPAAARAVRARGVPCLLACAACCLLLSSCKPRPARPPGGSGASAGLAAEAVDESPRHAKGYTVRRRADGVRLVDLRDPQSESPATYHFALVPRGQSPADIPDGYTAVSVPVRSVICMTSLQLSNFICLGRQDLVTGITSTRHLFNKEMNRQLAEGRTRKIGIEGQFDNEVIMAMNPDVILISPFKRGGYETMRETGIPLVPHLGYKETTPLGQAEWVKLAGLLAGMEEEAGRRFADIERRYEELRRLASGAESRPVAFSGEMRGGNWYAVGGRSFLAQLFRDAGADYFLKDDTSSGGVTLDYETVYSQAESADYWRIVNSYDGDYSYEALRASDERYADFRAFRERHVLYCNMRRTPFYENMPVEPDVVLADLIHAFHPGLLPGHEPVYYSLLR